MGVIQSRAVLALDATEVAWAAGVLEGEAYFGVHGGQPEIRLEMTDRDVVERVAAVFGVGRMSERKKSVERQVTFLWSVRAAKAVRLVIEAVEPWLGDRRSGKAREVLVVAKGIVPQGERTHCKNGHPFDGVNSYVEIGSSGRSRRVCRACRNERVKRVRRRAGVSSDQLAIGAA